MTTIRDVAEAAEVSIATVSRALRGLPSVTPATRRKVLEAAERLMYVPDPYAARLAATRAHTIIVAVPYPGQWYYGQVVAGVEAVASEAGFDLHLHVVGDDVQRRHFIDDVLATQLRRVDGAILVDIPIQDHDVGPLIDRGVVLVAVGQHIDGIVTVGIDNRAASREATDFLIRQGHRRIGLIGGMPDGRSLLTVPGEREAGFRQALSMAGISLDEELVVDGNFSIGGGFDATSELLQLADPPTAIFALSDEMAAGAMQAARERGVGVPGELAIVGFDDHDFAAAIGLTTVRQPALTEGEWAAQALLDAIEGAPWEGDRLLGHHMVLRDTTHTD